MGTSCAKRNASVALIAVFFSLALCMGLFLAGCGGQPVLARENFVGHWTFVSTSDGAGKTYTAEDVNGLGLNSDSILSFDLGAEGDATLKTSDVNPAEGDEKVTWETTPKGVALKSGGSSVELAYDEATGYLTMPVGESGSTVFAKQ